MCDFAKTQPIVIDIEQMTTGIIGTNFRGRQQSAAKTPMAPGSKSCNIFALNP
jgi:hypothetical protein